MAESKLHRAVLEEPGLLLLGATAVATVSYLLHDLPPPNALIGQVIFGYVPIVLGCIAVWLCIRARRKTAHKRLVTLYTVALSPFAFGYPAWIVVLWFLYASGRYKGPMP